MLIDIGKQRTRVRRDNQDIIGVHQNEFVVSQTTWVLFYDSPRCLGPTFGPTPSSGTDGISNSYRTESPSPAAAADCGTTTATECYSPTLDDSNGSTLLCRFLLSGHSKRVQNTGSPVDGRADSPAQEPQRDPCSFGTKCCRGLASHQHCLDTTFTLSTTIPILCQEYK